MEDEINLNDIFDVLWRNRLMIIGVFIIAILVGGVISFAMPPIYRTSSIIALGNFAEPIYTSQSTALQIMQSDEFLIDVFKELNKPPDKFRDFKDSIRIVAVTGTDNLLKISVDSKSRQDDMETIQGIIQLFGNRSEWSYNLQMKILSDHLAVTKSNLDILNSDLNATRATLKNIQNNTNASGETVQQTELRSSRMIEYLKIEEDDRQASLESYLDLNKQLTLARHLLVVQEPREPLIPVEVQRIMIMAIAGMLGLIIGIFAAFLKGGFWRRTK